ncbi:MAG: hypothetical protein RLZZ237_87, partial [Pseudomonadota bacterium]
ILYEDFLPVSAAGIFQSNLGGPAGAAYATRSNRDQFAEALGQQPYDELALYASAELASLQQALSDLGLSPDAATALLQR